jgi:HAD superfamily hydrolase (TIGR01459 family)
MLDRLDIKYGVILCDIWGCLHNGVEAYQGAVNRLQQWQEEGRTVILLTNAPRPAASVAAQLTRLGISPSCYNGIITSGDAGLAWMGREYPSQSFNFIGSDADREILGPLVALHSGNDRSNITICTGFHEGHEDDISYHDGELRQLAESGGILMCFNPDKVVVRGSKAELCAGALGERCRELGGQVQYFGKPHMPIYDLALATASAISNFAVHKSDILAIGDGMETDLFGAYKFGLDFAFITGGIEGEKIARLGIAAVLDEMIATRQMTGYTPRMIAERL